MSLAERLIYFDFASLGSSAKMIARRASEDTAFRPTEGQTRVLARVDELLVDALDPEGVQVLPPLRGVRKARGVDERQATRYLFMQLSGIEFSDEYDEFGSEIREIIRSISDSKTALGKRQQQTLQSDVIPFLDRMSHLNQMVESFV